MKYYGYYDRKRVSALGYCNDDTVKACEFHVNLEHSAGYVEFTRDEYTGEVYADIHADSFFDAIQVWDSIVDWLWDNGVQQLYIGGFLEARAAVE